MYLLAALTLAACGTPQPSGRCAYVDKSHLASPRNDAGQTLICDPQRVSATYRKRYFPDYSWGDER